MVRVSILWEEWISRSFKGFCEKIFIILMNPNTKLKTEAFIGIFFAHF